MSLISNVDKILKTKNNLNDIGYLKKPVSYSPDLDIIGVEWRKLLPAPPKNDSITTIKELKVVSDATKNRTQAELDLVITVDKDPVNLYYKFLESKNLKFPKSKFFTYWNIFEQIVFALKYYYNRARPEQIAPYHGIEINVLHTDTHQTPAYPSGHAMYGEVAAYVLSDMYPEYKDKFLEMSEYAGLARVLQGVHYPSDNEASRIIVENLYDIVKEKLNEYKRNQEISINIPRTT